MNEERFTRRAATGLDGLAAAFEWARKVTDEMTRQRDAHDVQVVIEQSADGWTAVVSGTCVVQ